YRGTPGVVRDPHRDLGGPAAGAGVGDGVVDLDAGRSARRRAGRTRRHRRLAPAGPLGRLGRLPGPVPHHARPAAVSATAGAAGPGPAGPARIRGRARLAGCSGGHTVRRPPRWVRIMCARSVRAFLCVTVVFVAVLIAWLTFLYPLAPHGTLPEQIVILFAGYAILLLIALAW